MKRKTLLTLMITAAVAVLIWLNPRAGMPAASAAEAAADKPAGDEEAKTTITHDTNGNVVIGISDEVQGNIGIVVTNPAASQLAPEMKGYGRVMDPGPLAALGTELATAEASYTASSNELARLKSLETEGNASARALQTAQAGALHDQLAIRSARDRLALASSKALADQDNLPGFLQSLASQEAMLVRVDLPAGDSLPGQPAGARLQRLSGNSVEAAFFGAAPSVDPQAQGQGFLFLVRPNSPPLLAGEALTGYIKLPGEPLSGVIIPRDAVLRAAGKAWVYVLNSGGEGFTRKQISLEHPTEAGWFVTTNFTAQDYVIITGAQTLYSEELNSSGYMGGGRD